MLDLGRQFAMLLRLPQVLFLGVAVLLRQGLIARRIQDPVCPAPKPTLIGPVLVILRLLLQRLRFPLIVNG